MQSVLSRIWTRVAVSIPYDDSHYTTLLPLLPGLLVFGVVVPVRVSNMLNIELFNHLLRIINIITIGYLKHYWCVQIIWIWEEYVINRIT